MPLKRENGIADALANYLSATGVDSIIFFFFSGGSFHETVQILEWLFNQLRFRLLWSALNFQIRTVYSDSRVWILFH